MIAPEHSTAALLAPTAQTRRRIAMSPATGYHASVPRRFECALSVAFVCTTGLVAGCYITDPDHCHNNGGDVACSDPDFPVCSKCVTSELRGGCVAEAEISAEEAECRSDANAEGSGTATTTETSGSEDTATATEGPGGDCSTEGIDASCDPSTPYCVDGTCSACTTAGGDDYCANLDGTTPVCFDTGVCTACDADSLGQCGGMTPFCNDVGACVGCSSHAQCRDASADQDRPQGCNFDTGACLDGQSFWVDPDDCVPPGFGLAGDPYCSIDDALSATNLENAQISVWLRSSSSGYDTGIRLVGGSESHYVAIAGVSDRVTITRDGEPVSVVTNSSNRLMLENVRIEGGTIGAQVLSSGRLWLNDVIVTDNDIGVGLDMQGRGILRNSTIFGNATVGIEALMNSRVTLENMAVIANGSGADTPGGMSLQNVADFTILYSTIAGNLGTAAGNDLTCDTTSVGTIRNSIFMSDAPGVDAICPAAIFDSCAIDNNGADPDPVAAPGSRNVPYSASYFAGIANGNAHISGQTTLDLSDVAVWRVGDPAQDVDGDPRPGIDGAPDWPGFDVP